MTAAVKKKIAKCQRDTKAYSLHLASGPLQKDTPYQCSTKLTQISNDQTVKNRTCLDPSAETIIAPTISRKQAYSFETTVLVPDYWTARGRIINHFMLPWCISQL